MTSSGSHLGQTVRRSSAEESVDKNDARFDASSMSNDHADVYRDSASPQAQMLLTAFQNVILPLVEKSGIPHRDTHRDSCGPEAEELLSALRKYVSYIVISSQTDQALSADGNERTERLEHHLPDAKEDNESPDEKDSPPNILAAEQNTIIGNSKDLNPPKQSRSLEKMLTGLRLHVFNNMPIRLLCFETNGSKSNITLLERGAVYAYLERKLRAEFSSATFLNKVSSYMEYGADQSWAAEQVVQNWVSRIANYAILSHTWLRGAFGEVTYGEWRNGTFDAGQPGYQKLANFCKVAADDYGLTLSWVDTVCINKESSTELDESIRSMYKWYRDAQICVTYLAHTSQLADIYTDPWFSRGWTLQELLAPSAIKFYNKDWMQFMKDDSNDKQNPEIQQQIEMATTITSEELGPYHIAPISRRMEWAAQHEVTREEDIAYSLMGIFGVSISIAYGEGAGQAFRRLLKEILNSTHSVLDIFNWAGPYAYDKSITSLLPSHPKAYLRRNSNVQLKLRRPMEPLTLTHLGLRIPLLIMPAVPTQTPKTSYSAIGEYYATLTINTPDNRSYPRSYNLLDKRSSTQHAIFRMSSEVGLKVSFGVLNIRGDETNIYIPRICLAIVLSRDVDSENRDTGESRKVVTDVPTVFRLDRGKSLSDSSTLDDGGNAYYEVKRTRLALHGMQLLTMYL